MADGTIKARLVLDTTGTSGGVSSGNGIDATKERQANGVIANLLGPALGFITGGGFAAALGGTLAAGVVAGIVGTSLTVKLATDTMDKLIEEVLNKDQEAGIPLTEESKQQVSDLTESMKLLSENVGGIVDITTGRTESTPGIDSATGALVGTTTGAGANAQDAFAEATEFHLKQIKQLNPELSEQEQMIMAVNRTNEIGIQNTLMMLRLGEEQFQALNKELQTISQLLGQKEAERIIREKVARAITSEAEAHERLNRAKAGSRTFTRQDTGGGGASLNSQIRRLVDRGMSITEAKQSIVKAAPRQDRANVAEAIGL